MKCFVCNGTGKVSFDALSFGERLRFAREAKKLSLRDVETTTGISNAVLSQYETGKVKQPSFQAVMQLCKLYGITPEELQS